MESHDNAQQKMAMYVETLKEGSDFRTFVEQRFNPKDYKIRSEPTESNTHRAHIVHRTRGTTMYLGSHGHKTPEHAHKEAEIYLSNYSIGPNTADRAVRTYLKGIREQTSLEERPLTSFEKKKREEVAKAIERDDPSMDKSKKMAIATSVAKRVS